MDKTLVTRSTGMLLLKLIESEDMYGYQMIEELEILQHNKGGQGGAFRQNQGVAGVFPRP